MLENNLKSPFKCVFAQYYRHILRNQGDAIGNSDYQRNLYINATVNGLMGNKRRERKDGEERERQRERGQNINWWGGESQRFYDGSRLSKKSGEDKNTHDV